MRHVLCIFCGQWKATTAVGEAVISCHRAECRVQYAAQWSNYSPAAQEKLWVACAASQVDMRMRYELL